MNEVVVGDTNSDDRRNPKNAVEHAAQSIQRSCELYIDAVSDVCIRFKSVKVIGLRIGFLVALPCFRFRLRTSIYSRGSGGSVA